MTDELTTKMHSEFTLSDEEERKVNAFAAFQSVSDTISLTRVLDHLGMNANDVEPFVAQWNSLSAKQIIME